MVLQRYDQKTGGEITCYRAPASRIRTTMEGGLPTSAEMPGDTVRMAYQPDRAYFLMRMERAWLDPIFSGPSGAGPATLIFWRDQNFDQGRL